jgi:uncharacterized protein with PhoU and TrkA domain
MNFADDVTQTAGTIAETVRRLTAEIRDVKQVIRDRCPEAAGRLNLVQASMLVVNTDCGALVTAVRTAITTRQIPAEAGVRVADFKSAAAGDTD